MKKGFTLIELLGVIVILAIIALIATTIVMGVIDKSKESLLFRSAGYYVDAVELSIKNIELSENIILNGMYSIMDDGNVCLGTLKNNSCSKAILPVEATGDRPTKGSVIINNNHLLSISFNLNDQELARSVEDEIVYKDNIICTSVIESLTGNTPQGDLMPGDEYLCEVKPGTKYNFFVVGVDGDNVSLILDRNINSDGSLAEQSITKSSTNTIYSKEAWISKEDYGNEDNYGGSGNNNKGPLTAIKFLKIAVDDWINIPELNETYIDENVNYGVLTKPSTIVGYGAITLTERARLPKYSEIYGEDKCNPKEEGSCPLWLVNYLRDAQNAISGMNGYWVLSSGYDGLDCDTCKAINVNYTGKIFGDRVSRNDYHGIRPVITVSKKNIG